VMLDWAIALLVPALVAFAAAGVLLRSRWAAPLADLPNARSMHATPTPRVGGIAILLGALPIATAFAWESLAVPLACAVALAIVSIADDARDLPIQVRLPAHVTAAAIAVLVMGSAGAHEPLGVVQAIAAIVAVAWMTNLFNFMDGADGLAGGMAVAGFSSLAAAAAIAGQAPLALACAAIASASAGFLPRNFPPARIFMGDAGSVPLGFLAGAIGLQGALGAAWPLWFPILVFSPFIVDASLTIMRRILRGERFWRAHRDHAYQRLLLAGWPPSRLVYAAYALMAACAASALAGLAAEEMARFGILLVWMAMYALLLFAVERVAGAANRSHSVPDTKDRPIR
jgi:UDP-N-acetylmuramyl pentapeptide phosphotransferase/UDP-N-acetylglucosamine-1-phosphate transferase